MKKHILVLSLLFIGLLFFAHSALAQSSPLMISACSTNSSNCIGVTTSSTAPASGSPTILTSSLRLGSTDALTKGQVSQLQNFLIGKRYLVLPAGVSSGFFGQITQAAVIKFQRANNIYPSVGYVGPLTRATIVTGGYVTGGYLDQPIISNSTTQISSLSPSSGPVGTQVTIYGSGFTSMGNTVNFGGGVIQNVSANLLNSSQLSTSRGGSLTFTVPSSITPGCYYSSPRCYIATTITAPGTYPVSVTNGNGTSNSMSFTVTSSRIESGNFPVIHSVSAPNTLAVDQSGTWTVLASDSAGGQLTYSVRWGDENSHCSLDKYSACAQLDTTPEFQQSTSFTHSYSKAGTYTQTFTVRNSLGREEQASTNVQVGSGGINSPSLNQVSPTSGPVNTQVTLYGSGFTATGNKINFSGGEYYNLSNLNSSNGAITFNIPESTDYGCFHTKPQCYIASEMTSPGNHTISVTNANGTSNSVNFTVSDSNQSGAPYISSVNPTSGGIGTRVTLLGQRLSPTLMVRLGTSYYIKPDSAAMDSFGSSELSFIVPTFVYGCPNPDSCDIRVSLSGLSSTNYPLVLTDRNGNVKSNTVYFSLTSGTQTSGPTIISITPTSGPVGRQVTISGFGFRNANYIRNVLLVDGGEGGVGTISATQGDAETLIFTIPSSVSHPSCNSFIPESVCLQSIISINAGNHSLAVRNANGNSNAMNFTVTASTPTPIDDYLPNVSSRAQTLSGNEVAISGFTITGSGDKQVLIRGIGPSLANVGLSGVLADPTISLYGSSGLMMSNNNWKDTQQSQIQATTLAPTNDLESAILTTLSPGVYTVILSGNGGGTGIGNVEMYDVGGNARLTNASTRGKAGLGDNVLISGMIVRSSGNRAQSFLIRGIGPSLSSAGLSGLLADPKIDLYNQLGNVIVSNDNWQSSQAADIQASGLAPSNPNESAIFANLLPGSYTVILRGVNNSTGLAKVSIDKLSYRDPVANNQTGSVIDALNALLRQDRQKQTAAIGSAIDNLLRNLKSFFSGF